MSACQRCGGAFTPKEPTRPARFCSLECGRTWRSDQVASVCKHCGREFQQARWRAARSTERGPFCGFACYGAWQRLNTAGAASHNWGQPRPSGPAHHAYKPINPNRRSGQWETTRLAAMERDGHRCQDCGSEKRLVVHHLVAWNRDDINTHALENTVTLCRRCHPKRHANVTSPS